MGELPLERGASPPPRSLPAARPRIKARLSCLLLLAAVLGAGTRGLAGEPLPPATEAGLFAFANKLRDEGDFDRAVTEYRRLLFHFPRGPHADAARLELARCYARAKQWDKAEEELTRLASQFAEKDLGREASYELAKVRFAAGQFEAAASAYDAFATDYPEAPRADEARWRKAWSLLLAHRFALAALAFRAIEPPSPHAAAARDLAAEAIALESRPRKSPLVAGLLGIVPGLGHIYVGKYRDGLVSLVFNGLVGWGSASAFSKGAKAAGAVLGLFGVNFYVGSIFGGVNWAHRVNRAAADRRIDELRRKHGV